MEQNMNLKNKTYITKQKKNDLLNEMDSEFNPITYNPSEIFKLCGDSPHFQHDKTGKAMGLQPDDLPHSQYKHQFFSKSPNQTIKS